MKEKRLHRLKRILSHIGAGSIALAPVVFLIAVGAPFTNCR